MPSKRTSNDIDFVLPTQYNVQPNRIAKEPPPEPWPLPDFTPLNIHDFNDHGKPNLPPDLNLHDPFALFSQFFTDDIMDRLVEWTNTYAGLHPAKEDEGHPEHPRKWTRTCKEELYAYLAVLIHMGISAEPCIEDYWGDLESHGSKHIVSKYIGLCRFQQLDRYFRCTTPWPKGDPTPRTTFDRVAELAEHLRLTCRKLYNPGTHLAVDETIERFTGRASEIVNIPTKPTPEGFKIWVLANEGYVLDWLWHARGDKGGPVDLDETFTKEEGFSKTQAVVLDLLTQRDAESNEPLYLPGKHIVWLDNLFTSVKLLTRLRELGIGGAGTVRTTRTKREEQGDIEGDVLAVSVGRKKKVPTEQIDQRLVNLKLTHSAQLQWGTLYGATLKDGQVMEFAWKDANVVLFMSTVDDGRSSITTRRRRPPITATGARQTRKVFGNKVEKDLPIPTFIFYYNYCMGGVDRADQRRAYYNTQRKHMKTWKPLFHFLINTVLSNCFLLSSYTPADRQASRRDSHKQFRKDLRDALFKRSIRNRKIYAQNPPSRRATDEIVWYPTHHHKLQKLWGKAVNCSACTEAGRKARRKYISRRKALSELSTNTVKKPRDRKDWKRPQRAPRTKYGCSVCKIPFCRQDECWLPHIERLNSKE